MIDSTGKLVIKPEWVGFIDEKGNVVVPPRRTAASDFSEGLAFVVDNRKEGFVDHSGKLVIDLE